MEACISSLGSHQSVQDTQNELTKFSQKPILHERSAIFGQVHVLRELEGMLGLLPKKFS